MRDEDVAAGSATCYGGTNAPYSRTRKKSSFCRQRIRIHVDIGCTQQWLKVVETKESEGCKLIKGRQVLLEGERHT